MERTTGNVQKRILPGCVECQSLVSMREKKPEDPQADCYCPVAVTKRATAVRMKATAMLSSRVMWFLLRK